MRPSKHLVQFSIWKGGWGILDIGIDTQLNSLKTKWIQRLLNPTNAFWKGLMLYWLNLIFNSNQGLVLFRQTQILKSTLALKIPVFTVSQRNISANIFNQVSPPTRDLKRNWLIIRSDWKCKTKKKLLKNPSSRPSVLTTVVLGR